MVRASSAPLFAFTLAISAGLLDSSAFAQATIRPIPAVARSWESTARPAVFERGKAIPTPAVAPASAPVDLDFIGPPEFPTTGAETGPAPDETIERVTLDLFGTGIGSSNFQGNQGSVTTQRGGWEVGLGRYEQRGWSFAAELGTEASFYDYGGNASPVPGVGDPFNDVYDTHLSGRFLHRGDGRLEVYGGVQLGNSGEDAVGIDDSIYVGGAAAMRYQAAPEFALLVGIAGISRFDDSPWILPYIGFDWQVSEDLRLKTEAAEIHADYRMGADWSLGLEAVYDFRQYRLNETGPLNGGSFRDEEIRLGGSLAYQVSEGVQLEVAGGKILWREVVFHDGDAGYIGETELSSPYYVGLGIEVSF